MQFFVGNSLWGLIRQADFLSSLVLLTLIGMSILCWTIAIYKWLLFRQKKHELQQAITKLRSAHTIEELVTVGQSLINTLPGSCITRALSTSKKLLTSTPHKKNLSDADVETLRTDIAAITAELSHEQSSYLNILRVNAEAGPLVGLFGTVWGLIHAFIRISQEQNADIVTVAPGIAEALITTLAGLVVAIPALVFFHALHTQLTGIENQLITVAELCERIIITTLHAGRQP